MYPEFSKVINSYIIILNQFSIKSFFIIDSTNTPSKHGGSIWDGSNSNHRQHLFHGSTNAHHHNHPLLSPQLDIGSTERTLQSVHGQNNRGLMNQQLSSAKVFNYSNYFADEY